MDMTNPLFKHTATAENGAGFLAELSGGLSFVTALTPAAAAWLRAKVGEESSWFGDQLTVENRYFPDLADAIMEAGFTFERSALAS